MVAPKIPEHPEFDKTVEAVVKAVADLTPKGIGIGMIFMDEWGTVQFSSNVGTEIFVHMCERAIKTASAPDFEISKTIRGENKEK